MLALLGGERLEADLEGEAPQRRLVDAIEQVGGADEHAVVALHLLQHLVDLGDFVAALGAASVQQKAVGFVQQQHRLFLAGFLEHGGHVLLGLADELAHQVAGLPDDQRLAHLLGNVFTQRGLAGARCAVEAQRAMAARLQRLDDARHLEAAFDVQHAQVVGGDAAPPLGRRALAAAPQRGVGVLQLALDQRLEGGAAAGVVGMRQIGKAHRGADLRRRQALALGQPHHQGLADLDPVERPAHQLLTRAGRR